MAHMVAVVVKLVAVEVAVAVDRLTTHCPCMSPCDRNG